VGVGGWGLGRGPQTPHPQSPIPSYKNFSQ